MSEISSNPGSASVFVAVTRVQVLRHWGHTEEILLSSPPGKLFEDFTCGLGGFSCCHLKIDGPIIQNTHIITHGSTCLERPLP